jgi:histone H1/5
LGRWLTFHPPRSRQAIKKYIQANNNLGNTSETAFAGHLARALKSGEENGIFERPKGK